MKVVLRFSGIVLLLVGLYFVVLDTRINDDMIEEQSIELESHIVNIEDLDTNTVSIETLQKFEENELKTMYRSMLEISDLDILAPILNDVSNSSLKKGVGLYPETKGIGEKGNCVIAGHSSLVYDCIFNNLHSIELGTRINVYDENCNSYTYIVTVIKNKVEPTDLTILESTDISKEYLTLLTCTDYGKKRFVVVAEMER